MEGRLRRLSVAHWARNLRERNRYNTFTRFGSLCIPFGCGAGGRLPGHYFFQEGSLKKYYELVDKNIKPVTTGMVLPENTDFFRELVGNMENLSVNLTALGKKFDLDLLATFAPLLEQWKNTGLVKLSDSGWLEFTVAGEFWNVTLAQNMLEYFTKTQANSKNSV